MNDFIRITLILIAVFGGATGIYLLRNYANPWLLTFGAIVLSTGGIVAFILWLDKKRKWRHRPFEEDKD